MSDIHFWRENTNELGLRPGDPLDASKVDSVIWVWPMRPALYLPPSDFIGRINEKKKKQIVNALSFDFSFAQTASFDVLRNFGAVSGLSSKRVSNEKWRLTVVSRRLFIESFRIRKILAVASRSSFIRMAMPAPTH